MPWGAQQWVKITREIDNASAATYGVYITKTTPVEGTDFIWIRIDQNNGMSIRMLPAYYTIRSADAGNRRVQTGTARAAVSGALQTLLYPTQAGFLLDAGLQTNFASSGDLLSYSIEYFDTVKTHRFLGCKVAKLSLKGEAMGQLLRLNLDWIGQKPATSPPALAAPTGTNFPAGQPYVHQDSQGVVKLNATVRLKYSSLDVEVTNHLAPTFDELQFITALYYAGRDVDWTLKSQYTAVADRAAYEAATVQITNQVSWVKGANSVTLDLKSSNFVTELSDELPLDNAAYQIVKVASMYDRTAVTDLAHVVV